MPSKAPAARTLPAKTRILRAAMLLFARTPFSETSLRDIAAEAQVDVAYVHRAFGSKAEIFRQALKAASPLDDLFAQPADPDTVLERLCERAFTRDPDCVEDVEMLHLAMQSCSCSEARSILEDLIRTEIARPLADVFGHKDTGRAMLATSFLNGVITMRLLFGSESMRNMPKDQMKALLVAALRGVMSG
ncbi:TetR family transcriptional regulator [Paracoccus sp. DMF-8]|uniref:TetR/AcrR family transcriptional regulator n=1 Tax=Paracoccus sp. DMF-8 TaxID=3019445 RepID=UPI0023E434F8|nr:TetR/AcrR family transcriptional regulator [Paracoccus sp. DMF-8]MDF3607484.1 TetR family transcriptional regulator [Paracoccus sp. DMF-8]